MGYFMCVSTYLYADAYLLTLWGCVIGDGHSLIYFTTLFPPRRRVQVDLTCMMGMGKEDIISDSGCAMEHE